MILLSKKFLVFLSSLLWATNIYASRLHLRRPSVRHAADSGGEEELNCRVTIKETTFGDGENGGIQDEDDIVCIQQVDEEDSSTILSLADLPSHIYDTNEKKIAVGRLYMSLTGIRVDACGNVIMSDETEFTVLENNGKRKLAEEDELPIGAKTLAVVRISTRDAQVTATASELQQMVLDNGPHASNIMSQYQEMSFGQLTFKPKGVYEIYIDGTISSFTGLNISEAAEIAIVEQLGLEKASDLADRVLFCVPPGLQKGFIAFTYRNYWRATFSDKFCHSMSATIHEIGHTFGLGHSHWEEPNDYQDISCYQGLGGSDAHAPRQTFNAHKGWQTQWYASRHLSFDPFADEAQRIEVVALVDFEKANEGQAVIVNIADHIYFQYNRAKGFNNETRAMPDKLVVVKSHGNGNSGRIAALGPSDQPFEIPDFMESGQRLIIEVCGEEFGDEVMPDILVVSVGFGESACSAPEEEEPVFLPPPPPSIPSDAPISAPTKTPSSMPSKRPSHAPSHHASAAPTKTPSIMPSTTPSYAPSNEAGAAPTKGPSSIPSTAPSNIAPSPSPSHAPSVSPNAPLSLKPSVMPSSEPTLKPRTPTASPSLSPSTSPSAIPSSKPSASPSSWPSTSPSLLPSSRPTASTSLAPSTSPSSAPSITPSSTPSSTPSETPSTAPSATPSSSPSSSPIESPSSTPSTSPSSTPSSSPSTSPSYKPSSSPSTSPSGSPSSTPSAPPSSSPSALPSLSPSANPSASPSALPSASPSLSPSAKPSSQPSLNPSNAPSQGPSVSPSRISSVSPSRSPTSRPSTLPSTTPSTLSSSTETDRRLR